MEGHKCKLCLKSFSNGRALGGHMRSHMINMLKLEDESPAQLSEGTDSEPSASSSLSPAASEEEEQEEQEEEIAGMDEKGLSYELRENPKRSFRMVDPEFFDAGSVVVLQDRESETESKHLTRRRSKRIRKSVSILEEDLKKVKLKKPGKSESWPDPESVSSISNVTAEEDVAFCLMMLSRDRWNRNDYEDDYGDDYEYKDDEEDKEDDVDEEEEEEEEKFMAEIEEQKLRKSRGRGKYKCDTCNKVFRSYQALGGHRASHKKIRTSTPSQLDQEHGRSSGTTMAAEKKIHECPFCFRVFSSGQALGGHKRSHFTGAAMAPPPPLPQKKLNNRFIDLNLPAPVEEDDLSQTSFAWP